MLKTALLQFQSSNFLKQRQNLKTFLWSNFKCSSYFMFGLNTNQALTFCYKYDFFYYPLNITSILPLFPNKKHIPLCHQYNTSFMQYTPVYSRNFLTSSSSHGSLGRNRTNNTLSIKHRSTLYYIIAIGVLAVGLSYAAVPLYRIFCQAYSYGGTTQQAQLNSSKIEAMVRREDMEITVHFNADISASLNWNFKPQQSEVKVRPGETALAFYSARNPTDRQVIGISTYNVIPFEAGQYFNKIQCFCFEEQMLNPNEEVSMPVFFYIDPEFGEDPKMEFVREITLSYTFFGVKDLKLPLPGFTVK